MQQPGGGAGGFPHSQEGLSWCPPWRCGYSLSPKKGTLGSLSSKLSPASFTDMEGLELLCPSAPLGLDFSLSLSWLCCWDQSCLLATQELPN